MTAAARLGASGARNDHGTGERPSTPRERPDGASSALDAWLRSLAALHALDAGLAAVVPNPDRVQTGGAAGAPCERAHGLTAARALSARVRALPPEHQVTVARLAVWCGPDARAGELAVRLATDHGPGALRVALERAVARREAAARAATAAEHRAKRARPGRGRPAGDLGAQGVLAAAQGELRSASVAEDVARGRLRAWGLAQVTAVWDAWREVT